MIVESKIKEAIRANEITKILLIDDAYDPPEIEKVEGSLLGYLDSGEGRKICESMNVNDSDRIAAISALENGELDKEELLRIYNCLYESFTKDMDGRFDPEGKFRERKEADLTALSALYELLWKCANKKSIHTAGIVGGLETYKKLKPQIIFLDYYLSDDVQPTGKVSDYRKQRARNDSLNLLKNVVDCSQAGNIPAVILMSSRDIREYVVVRYRRQVQENSLMAVRFRFLRKVQVKHEAGKLAIDHDAADAILDIFQGFKFGKSIQEALEEWRIGTEEAISSFLKEIGDIQMKEFAYLLRFRLRHEEQALSEYLEWLFGECLTSIIGEKVDWNHDSFQFLDGEDLFEREFEGGFSGPTRQIANFFHRARFGSRVNTRRGKFQMGDLYGDPDEGSVRAIITPDCDLVRRNKKKKMNAKNILTMRADVKRFNSNDVSADNFILLNEKPYSLQWKPKDLMTYKVPTDEKQEFDAGNLVGTLRPLYAQEMQRRVLTDLSRVGVPVAPAIGFNAKVSVWMRKNDGCMKRVSDEFRSSRLATLIPPRDGEKEMGFHVLLYRPLALELTQYLASIDPDSVRKEDKSHLISMRNKQGKNDLFRALISEGRTGQKEKANIGFFMNDKPKQCDKSPFLQIVVEISEDESAELKIVDPISDE